MVDQPPLSISCYNLSHIFAFVLLTLLLKTTTTTVPLTASPRRSIEIRKILVDGVAAGLEPRYEIHITLQRAKHDNSNWNTHEYFPFHILALVSQDLKRTSLGHLIPV